MSERTKESQKQENQKVKNQKSESQSNAVCTKTKEADAQQLEYQQLEHQQLEEQALAHQQSEEQMLEYQPSSRFLIAGYDSDRQRQMELLYEILGPVFFGEKRAETEQELEQYFRQNYSIDVKHDFYEGDEHYDEYLEAQQAIAEGMSIYGGSIAFEDSALAKLADRIWQDMEKQENGGFRRINTALEE